MILNQEKYVPAVKKDGTFEVIEPIFFLCTSTRKGYVYTNVGRVALIFYTELTEESVV